MKTKNIITAVMLLMAAGIFVCCSKGEEPQEICICRIVNPVIINDIPWLYELKEQYKEQDASARIDQCTYNNGMRGFLIYPYADNHTLFLYDWEGTVLDNYQDVASISYSDFKTKWDIKDMVCIWIKY